MSRNPARPHTISGGPHKMNAEHRGDTHREGDFRGGQALIEVVVQIDDLRIAGRWQFNPRSTPTELIENVVALLTMIRSAMNGCESDFDTKRAA